jgi:ABC-type sugar transport system ATPase subunit
VVSTIRVRGLRVVRGDATVLRDVDLDVASGERLALLGSSGAGKTTLLRAIAGVQPLAAGRIWIGGREVTGLDARERGVGMVTQESTLQPHLDVRGNLAFPLRVRRVPAAEQRARVEAEARAFSLWGLLPRRPRTLSAGQRHEVALARTLVRRVDALLVDEPFAHLDPPRRIELQRELLSVQSGYGVTLLLATNDQRVALSCGERVAVLDAGRLVQLAPPLELFHRPATTFVAGLVGELPMDLHVGVALRVRGAVVLEAGPLRLRSDRPVLRGLVGRRIQLGIRPTAWELVEPGTDRPGGPRTILAEGTVRRREFTGARATITLATGRHTLVAVVVAPGPQVGDRVTLAASTEAVHVFDGDTGHAVSHGI